MQDNVLANGAEGRTIDWNAVNWRKVEKAVRNLRQRIFRVNLLEPCAGKLASTVLRGG